MRREQGALAEKVPELADPVQRSRLEQWIVDLRHRVGYHKTLVAIANKHARICWAILAKGESYDPQAWQRIARAA